MRQFVRHFRLIGIVGLVVTMSVLAAITLSPTTVDRSFGAEINWFLNTLHHFGAPVWFGYQKLEFAANILLFVPLGAFLAMVLPPGRRWIGALALPLLSATVEGVQLVFLPGRIASIFDVLANSLGAWIGLALVGVWIVLADLEEPARL